jgi:virginiamycin A acetyltransferase
MSTIKAFVMFVSELIMLPVVLLYRLNVLLAPARREVCFQGYSQAMSLLPGWSGMMLRCAFYRFTLTRCPRNVWIGFGTLLATPDIEIGENVYIGPRCMLGHVTIGDDVLLGSGVDILSGKHQHRVERIDMPIRLQGGRSERITIGSDVWIGNNATIMSDVSDQAVVAAGAVVVKRVAPLTIVAGNPARMLRERIAR